MAQVSGLIKSNLTCSKERGFESLSRQFCELLRSVLFVSRSLIVELFFVVWVIMFGCGLRPMLEFRSLRAVGGSGI